MEPKKESEKLNKAFGGFTRKQFVDRNNLTPPKDIILQEKLDRLESYLGIPFLQMPEEEKQQLLRIIKE